MIKIQNYMAYYKNKTTVLGKTKALKSLLLDFTALYFHEVCHWIVAFFTMQLVCTKIHITSFFEDRGDRYYNSAYIECTAPNTKIGHAIQILICAAPMIGLATLPLISPWFIIWIILSWDSFSLSNSDKEMIKESINILLNKNK